MSTKVRTIEIVVTPASPVKTITLFENAVDHGFGSGFYWVRTTDGKAYRFNTEHVVMIIEHPERHE